MIEEELMHLGKTAQQRRLSMQVAFPYIFDH
jgi:hypothetical protein